MNEIRDYVKYDNTSKHIFDLHNVKEGFVQVIKNSLTQQSLQLQKSFWKVFPFCGHCKPH